MERTNGATRAGHLEALGERARAGLPLFGADVQPEALQEDRGADDTPPQAPGPTSPPRRRPEGKPPEPKPRAGRVVAGPVAAATPGAGGRWRRVAESLWEVVQRVETPKGEAERWRRVTESLWDVVTPAGAGGAEAPAPAGPTCLPPVAATNEEWRWLSPLEEQILAVVTDEYRTAPELAAALKLTCSSDFRMVLRNLVARQILDSSGEGYRLRLP